MRHLSGGSLLLRFAGRRTGLELSSTRAFAGFADGPSKLIRPNRVWEEQ